MTEETRQMLLEEMRERWIGGAAFHEIVEWAYELGEKAGRSAQKEDKNEST